MLCGICGLSLATAGSLGYMAWMILTLVYAIQALVDHSSSNCTHASFEWLWWIAISSGLFAISMLQQTKKFSDFDSIKEFAAYIGLLWLFSLGFAIGTQYEYIDGCVGKAHNVMFVYMWGNYAVAMCLTVCSLCFIAEECFTKPTPPVTDLEAKLHGEM